MALRINLEIGHEASLRTKRTPEGFTHDWKIFVRGGDGTDIHYYVEKVVFYLHETFQKPKRVVKEPPYEVKESGYAGFNLPIDIYLRNSGEPKKIKFNYDLHLQPSGPPITKVQKEKHIFSSIPEDFKQKLLRGGGVVTSSSQESVESKSVLYEEKNQLISKPKFSGVEAPVKKTKMEPQMSNSFQALFGTPITKTSKIPEPKAQPPKENKNIVKTEKEKITDKLKSKHSPHKDKEKDRDRDKSDKKVKEEKKKDKDKKDKERERSKDKSIKKERSPKPRSPSPKHPSPKPSSPLPPPSMAQPVPVSKHRDKEGKSEKEKKDKTDKEDRKAKKEKKEKEHSKDKDKHRDSSKSDHKSKETKTKDIAPPAKEPEIPMPVLPTPAPPTLPSKQEKKDKMKDEEKIKVDRIDKSEDKKHKHKKKDKNKKDRKDKEEKSHKPAKKPEREKNMAPPPAAPVSTCSMNGGDTLSEKNNLFGSSPKVEPSSVTLSPKEPSKPLNKLFSTCLDAESDSSPSSREPSASPDAKKKEKPKKSDKKNIDKDSERKKKRKASSEIDQPPEKLVKEEENVNNNSDIENTVIKTDAAKNANNEAEDYMSILRTLQHKIMALKDNADLQKVVQLIAETGQYEISAHTFDFDLCLLDRTTVEQLQEFLSTTS